eukprot:2267514-Rhodomonas_salina.2
MYLNEVLDAILECLAMAIRFPDLDDVAALREIATGFRNKSDGGIFADCVGALDGILIGLEYVRHCDSPFPARFWTCKSKFALNVQAICDSQRRFTFFSIDTPGSTHDSIAWMYTDLWKELESRGLPHPFYLFTYAAYTGFTNVVCPFPGKS